MNAESQTDTASMAEAIQIQSITKSLFDNFFDDVIKNIHHKKISDETISTGDLAKIVEASRLMVKRVMSELEAPFLNINFLENDAHLILKALKQTKEAWIEKCKQIQDEDEKADLGMDVARLSSVEESLSEKAIEKFGQSVINFSEAKYL